MTGRDVALERLAVFQRAVHLLSIEPEIHWAVLNIFGMIANDHQARRLIHLPSILAMLVLAVACSSAPEPAQQRFIQRSRVSMGSQLTLSAWTTSERGAEDASSTCFASSIASNRC